MVATPRISVVLLLSLTWSALAEPPAAPYPWPHGAQAEALRQRVSPPEGFKRVRAPEGGFAAWLRELPTLPGQPPVLLFDGTPKRNQTAHALVLDVDVGHADLQQCADAVMRLRAEYLHASGRDADLCFHFTSGDAAAWERWKTGERPRVQGNHVRWASSAPARADRETFQGYLETVFTYSGSASLERDTVKPPPDARLEPGDVLLQGGHPGHAVLVLDVAEDAKRRRVFLLAQSYMPAQQIQLLKAPDSPLGPWYTADPNDAVKTPEWDFPRGSWRRFRERPCP